MDITQLVYFINIVECDCNLTLASKKVHVTQSALSQLVLNFEHKENVLLFTRKNGRLDKLTPAGQILYKNALDIVRRHQEMLKLIRDEASVLKSKIRIGSPPRLLRNYFSHFLPEFISHYKNTTIEIIEQGANELKDLLLQDALDYAILVSPTNLDERYFEVTTIPLGEYMAYMDFHHPLGKLDKINWSDLLPYPVGTLQKGFVSHDLIRNKLTEVAPETKIQLTSTSWEYLLEVTKNSNRISIMPSFPAKPLGHHQFLQKEFNHAIPFEIALCRPVKNFYSTAETYLNQSIIDFFSHETH